MVSIQVGIIIVAILFGSAMLAALVGRLLPENHLSPETKSVVSVSMAAVATLGALTLGLLISTSNTSFIAAQQQITQISADLIRLDRLLLRYGPEAQDARTLLRRYTAAKQRDLFPRASSQPLDLENVSTLSILEAVENRTLALSPANETQRWLQTQSVQIAAGMEGTRWRLVAESQNRTPFRFVEVLVFWFAIVFASFGLFAPRNMTAVIAIFLCSIAIGVAIRIAADLQTPFQGLIRVSNASLTQALEAMTSATSSGR
jgi:hypothetical protein